MMFVNSLKLFASNWVKCLKFLLYYFVVWGICVALFLPVFFTFKDIFVALFSEGGVSSCGVGVFNGSLGANLHNFLIVTFLAFFSTFEINLGMAIYGILIVFVLLPFLINVGKFTLNEMLYSYMTSKNKLGFFSALVKGLRKSLLFALCKTLHNIVFLAIMLTGVYAIGFVENPTFTTYLLPLVEFAFLVLIFSINQMTVLGWASALIVFDRSVASAYRKGRKAVKRHFWSIFGTTVLFFLLFWGLVILFGIYVLLIILPIATALLCVYNMTIFFTSQGMRFYINDTKILTPKKLEEVDNINKTASIL